MKNIVCVLLACLLLGSVVNFAFAEEDISISAGATLILQGSTGADEDEVDGTISADIGIEKAFGDYGLAFIGIEAGNGAGLDEVLATFGGVNADAGDSESSAEITEAWYEHYPSNALTVTFGKIDASAYMDDNEVAGDETTQFLAGPFTNSTAVEFPDDNGAGIRLAIAPSEVFELNLGVTEDDANWSDVANSLFGFIQANFKREGGNYRLYAWMDTSAHTEFLDETATDEKNAGFGVSLDQEFSDVVSGFLRAGWQKSEISEINYSWSLGAQFSASGWNRDEDVVGIALGQNIPSSDYGDAGNPDDSEGVMELYYSYKVNEHLTITPDIQIVNNPFGDGDANEIGIFSLRAQIDF
jgi:hypothetical protein